MEENKEELSIVDYSVSQTTLEQVHKQLSIALYSRHYILLFFLFFVCRCFWALQM